MLSVPTSLTNKYPISEMPACCSCLQCLQQSQTPLLLLYQYHNSLSNSCHNCASWDMTMICQSHTRNISPQSLMFLSNDLGIPECSWPHIAAPTIQLDTRTGTCPNACLLLKFLFHASDDVSNILLGTLWWCPIRVSLYGAYLEICSLGLGTAKRVLLTSLQSKSIFNCSFIFKNIYTSTQQLLQHPQISLHIDLMHIRRCHWTTTYHNGVYYHNGAWCNRNTNIHAVHIGLLRRHD